MLIIAPGQDAKYEYFFDFFNMEVFCVLLLKSLHRGDSSEYT